MEVSQKTKNRTTIGLSSSTPGYISEENKNTNSKRYMHSHVHSSIIYITIAKIWKQPKCPTTEEWIKKSWYIYIVEYYSAIKRNEIESFVETWMDLETVIQSEVGQKEKNKYRILMHVCGT